MDHCRLEIIIISLINHHAHQILLTDASVLFKQNKTSYVKTYHQQYWKLSGSYVQPDVNNSCRRNLEDSEETRSQNLAVVHQESVDTVGLEGNDYL